MKEILVIDRRLHSMPPLMTVIIPVFNTEKFVLRTLSSLREDKIMDIEIIIVDDGSEDNSMKVVLDWVNHYKKNVLIIKQKNEGLSEARNTALRYARGKYITFCDSDDWLNFEVVCQAAKYAEVTTAEIVMFRSVTYDDYTQNIEPFYDKKLWDKALSGATELVINSTSHPYVLNFEPNTNCRVIRRDFFERHINKFKPGIHYEDVAPHVLSLLKATKIGLIDDVGYYYRINRSGKITQQRDDKRFDMLTVAKETLFAISLISTSPPQKQAIAAILVRMIYWCGMNTRSSDRHEYYHQCIELFSKKYIDNRNFLICAMSTSESLREIVLMFAMLSGETSFISSYSAGQRNFLIKLAFIKCIGCNSGRSSVVFFKKIITKFLSSNLFTKRN